MPTSSTEPSASAAHDVSAAGMSAPDINALSYEEARDELVRVVNELERGAATLEQSLGLWERGEALAARCEQWLIGAKTRLDAARAANAEQSNSTAQANSTAQGSNHDSRGNRSESAE